MGVEIAVEEKGAQSSEVIAGGQAVSKDVEAPKEEQTRADAPESLGGDGTGERGVSESGIEPGEGDVEMGEAKVNEEVGGPTEIRAVKIEAEEKRGCSEVVSEAPAPTTEANRDGGSEKLDVKNEGGEETTEVKEQRRAEKTGSEQEGREMAPSQVKSTEHEKGGTAEESPAVRAESRADPRAENRELEKGGSKAEGGIPDQKAEHAGETEGASERGRSVEKSEHGGETAAEEGGSVKNPDQVGEERAAETKPDQGSDAVVFEGEKGSEEKIEQAGEGSPAPEPLVENKGGRGRGRGRGKRKSEEAALQEPLTRRLTRRRR